MKWYWVAFIVVGALTIGYIVSSIRIASYKISDASNNGDSSDLQKNNSTNNSIVGSASASIGKNV